MNLNTLRPAAITLQDSVGPTAVQRTLSGATGTSLNTDGTEVNIFLTKSDADTIKSLAMCTAVADCYLTMAGDAIADMVGNKATEIPQGSGVQTSSFGQDTTSVTMEEFTTFDLNTGILTLSFSEPVDPTTLRFDQITLCTERASPPNAISSYKLNNGSTTSNRGLVIAVRLTQGDLSNIKKDDYLCKVRALCFIQFTSSFVQDTSGNPVVAMLGGDQAKDALGVKTLVADTTAPALTSFALNMETHSMLLTFDEPVDHLSVKTGQKLTLANALVSPTETYTLSDNAVVTSTQKGEVISTTLSSSDVVHIKAHFGLAKSLETSFALAAVGLATDIAASKNINRASSTAVAANDFKSDTTAPQFKSFLFASMNLGQLELEFTEPVNASALSANLLTLQSTASGGTMYTFTMPGSVEYLDASLKTVLVFTMDSYDLERMKLLTSLAVTRASTYLSLGAGAVRDAAGLSSGAVLSTNAVQVTRYETPAPARLDSFELNMNGSPTLTLQFTGVMQASTVKVGEIRFQSKAADDASTVFYTLANSTATSGNGFRITIALGSTDANALKSAVGLADGEGNTFLSLTAESIKDVSNTPVIAVVKESAVQVRSGGFTPDTTAPALVSFGFTLDTGEVSLTFSEVVDSSSLDPSDFTIQDASTASQFVAVTGANGAVVPSSGANLTVSFRLLDTELNKIKQLGGLATQLDNTYLAAAAEFVRDMNNNPAVSISSTSAKKASSFATDSTAPQLKAFSLDMDGAANIILTFSETILASAVRPEFFTLHDSVPTTTSFTLTGGAATSVSETEVRVTLSQADINAITALESLARGATSTHLSVQSSGAADSSGNALVAIAASAALQASLYTADTTAPTITAFRLNLNTNRLSIDLSETIRVSDVQSAAMQLQSLAGAASVSVSLAGSQVAAGSVNGVTVEIVLDKAVQDAIRLEPRLATSTNNTFLVATNLAAKDMFGNKVVALVSSAALQLQQGGYTPDTTSPTLSSFAVNLDSGTLTMNFDEPVAAASFDVRQVAFKGHASGALSADQTHTLSGSSAVATATNALQLIVLISPSDLDVLKAKVGLLDSTSTTYLSFSSSLVKDMYGNAVNAEAAKAGLFDPDVSKPLLTKYGMDMESGVLTLTFNETMDAQSLKPTKLTLQLSSNAGSQGQHRLTGGTTLTTGPSAVVRLALVESDINDLKAKSIALGIPSTWLLMDSDAIADMVNINPIALVNNLNAKQVDVAGYVADSTPPTLSAFSLNMTGPEPSLILTFSETIRTSSLVASGITLQNVQNITLHTIPLYASILDINGNKVLIGFQHDYQTLTLSTATVPFALDNSRVVALHIAESDFNALAFLRQLADSKATSFLSLAPASGMDMFGLSLGSIHQDTALAVSTYVADTFSPVVRAFSLDMDGSIAKLSLTFSETVQASTFVPEQLMLQSARTQPASSYALTGGSWTVTDGTVLTINLTKTDMNAIKALRSLAVSRASTYLVADSSAVRDMANNTLVALPTNDALAAASYVADSTRPTLVSYAVDMDRGVMLLTFSETMSASDLIVSQLSLASTGLSDAAVFTLTGTSTVVNVDAPVLQVNMSVADLNEVKRLRPLALSQAATFLAASESAARDTVGNKVTAIAANSALAAAAFTKDSTAPRLVAFSLNMNTGLLALTFDETVDIATVSAPALTLMPQADSSAGAAALKTYTLQASSTASGQDGTVVTVALSNSDLNALKLIEGLADSAASTFLALGTQAVKDMSGNPAAPRTNSEGLQASGFVADTTAPLVTSYDLDMDAGTLTLRLSEVVRAASIEVTAMTIQAQAAPALLTGSNSFALRSNSTAGSQNTGTLIVTLSTVDLDAVKSIVALARGGSSSFLSMGAAFAEDMHGNKIAAIQSSQALQASGYTPDSTAPLLVSFALDRDQGTVTFVFSETVDAATFVPAKFALQDAALANLAQPVILAGTFVRVDNVNIVLTLGTVLLDAIKSMPFMATNTSNTFLTIAAGGVMDMFGLPISAVVDGSGIAAKSVLSDTVRPTLVSFDMAMTVQPTVVTVTLHFSEAVNAATLHQSRVTLQADALGSGETLVLSAQTGVFQASDRPTDIVLTLSAQEVASIQGLTSVARIKAATFLALQDGAVLDASGLPLVAVASSSAMAVSTYTVDFVRPEVVYFDLDLNLNRVLVKFSEDIVLSTFQATHITLQNKASQPTASITLGGTTNALQLGADATIVIVPLLTGDINAIAVDQTLATTRSDTFLSVTASAVKDVAENSARAVDATSGLQVRNYIQDTTRPALLAFELDMNVGNLTLTFSEVIRASSFSQSEVIIQNSAQAAGESVRLSVNSPGTVVTSDSTVLGFVLSASDANAVRSHMSLARTTSNTFLAIFSAAVEDMSGNNVVDKAGTGASQALQATNVVADSTATTMTAFAINMGLGTLKLTFAEPVIASSIVFDELVFLDAAGGAVSFNLTGGTITSAAFSTEVSINLKVQDLDNLKRKSLCTTPATCFLAFGVATIKDTSNLFVTARSTSAPLPVAQHFADLIAPALTNNGFSLFDLNLGQLVLSFNEAVRIGSVNVTSLTLQNFYDSPETTYTLTGGSVLTQDDGPEITIKLIKDDLDMIKTDRLLCVSRSTCYIMLPAVFLTDIAGNALTPTSPSTGNLNARRFNVDSTAPNLLSFNFDMDARTMVFTFDEPVSSKSFRATSLTVVGSDNSKQVKLTGGSTTSGDGTVIVLDMLTADINEIKRQDFAIMSTDTFLAVAATGVDDMAIAANPVVAIATALPLAVSVYTPDTTKPRLVAFVLDLNVGQLTMEFSEPIRPVSSLQLAKLRLQSTASSSAVSVVLTSGSLAAGTTDGATRFSVLLSSQDIEAIKVRQQLAAGISSTFIAMQDLAIVDMAGNSAEVISTSAALGASSLIEDASPTALQSFSLNMDNATLALTFSDVVVVSTLKVQGITVQDAVTGSVSYTLKSSTTVSANGLVILIALSREDLLGINAQPQLAKSRASTYVTMSAVAIDDIYGRSMLATIDGRALQAATFVGDATQPVVVQFSLDMGKEVLNIKFSEAVVPSSLNISFSGLSISPASIRPEFSMPRGVRRTIQP